MKEIKREILDRIANMENGQTIMVDNDIVPEIGSIKQVALNTCIIQVHDIKINSIDKIIIKFSITKNLNLPTKDILEIGVMTSVEGEYLKYLYFLKDIESDGPICFVFQTSTTIGPRLSNQNNK